MSCKNSRVFPVRVDQEAGEGAVRFGAGVKPVVLREGHLDPHLISGDQVKQGATGQRGRFGPVAVKLKIRGHSVPVLHQVKLQAGPVHCGVDGEVIHARDLAGEASGFRVVVALFVDQDSVETDCIAHGEG